MHDEAFEREVEAEVAKRLSAMARYVARPRWQRLLIAWALASPIVLVLGGVNVALALGDHRRPPAPLLLLGGVECLFFVVYATAIAVRPERVVRAVARDAMSYPTNAPGYRSAPPD